MFQASFQGTLNGYTRTNVQINDHSIIWPSCISDIFHTIFIFLPMQGEHHVAWDGEDILVQCNFLKQFIDRVIIIQIIYIVILYMMTCMKCCLDWFSCDMLLPSVCRESRPSRPQGRKWETMPLTCTLRRASQTAAHSTPSPSRRSPSTQTCCSTWTQNSKRWPPSAAPKAHPRKTCMCTQACIHALTHTYTHTNNNLVLEPTSDVFLLFIFC